MNKFWGDAAGLFTIILGILVNTIVPENWAYVIGFIFGTAATTIILITSRND